MIEGLYRQWRRLVRLFPAPARFGDATAHLHQAVEAPPVLPGAAPAIGVEANVDQAGVQLPTLIHAQAKSLQCIGAIAVEQNVGVLEQAFEYGAVGPVVQIKTRAAFSQGDFRHHPGLVPGRRIDAQDIGTEACQKATGNGACQYSGQIQHLDIGQRSSN
ncbi:hypothetical protein D3C78_1252340 [compost metagenome]